MGITDRDRKILWGRSGNLCAICKIPLVAERTADDPEAVVGDEAHIVARSPHGPRYSKCHPAKGDTYDNLILLCKVDHKMVDDQVQKFTAERLLRTKADHESWVKVTLQEVEAEPEPMRLEDDPSAEPLQLTLLRTGSDVWNIVAPAHTFYLGDLDDDAPLEQLDRTTEFLQLAQEWGEISNDIINQGMVAVREAKQSLTDSLNGLRERGLLVFGGRRRRILKGGIGRPTYWHDAVLEVVRADSVRIVTKPPS